MIKKYLFFFLAFLIIHIIVPAYVLAQDYGEGTYGSGVYGGQEDTEPPTTPGTPSTTSPTADTTPTWTWTASTDDDSGLASPPYTVEWSQDSDFGSGVSSDTAAANTFTHSSALAEGTWYFRVMAEDADGNQTEFSENGSVLIDTTDPTQPGTPSTTSPTNSTTQNWSWTAGSDGGSGILHYAWRVVTSLGDAVTNSTTATLAAVTNLTEGVYTFFVKTVDNVLNESAETSSSLTVDTSAPSISLTAFSPDPTTDTTPTLTGTATDTLTALTAIEYRVDSGSWTTCAADDGTIDETSEAFSCTISTLDDGTYTIQVRATDSATNTTSGGSVGSDTLTVDTTAPAISLTEYSPDPTTDSTPTLTGTATDALTALTAIEYQVDDGTWTTCTADDGTIDELSEAFSCNLPLQTDGLHSVNVRATDSVDNTTSGDDLGTDSFTISTTAPGIELDVYTPDPTTDTTPTLTGTAVSSTADLASIEYQVDGGSWSACTADDGTIDETTEDFSCTTSALSDGQHTVNVRATDEADNTTTGEGIGSDTFTVDTTAPSISLTALSPDPTNDPTPTFTGTATDTLSVLTAIQYQVDGGSWTTCTTDDGTIDETSEAFSCTLPAQDGGEHTINVRATDAATNTTSGGGLGSDTFTVDAAAPSISLTAFSPDPTTDTTPTLTGTATDALTALTAIEYQVDGGSWTTCTANDGTIDETSEAFSCTASTLGDGAHTINVRATDSASNTTSGGGLGSDTFTVDTTAPSISLTALSPDPTTDTTPTFTGTATDVLTALTDIEYQIDGGSWTTCTADDGTIDETSEAFSCTINTLDEGAHTVTVRATDALDLTSSGGSLGTDSFTVDTTAPTISLTEYTPDPTTDATPTLTGTATDNLTALTAIQYQVDGGSWAACTADDGAINEISETFSCTTSVLGEGTYTVNVRATDSANNTTSGGSLGSDSFTIEDPEPEPTPTPTPTPTPSSSSSSDNDKKETSCSASKPSSAPDLFQIDASQTSVKLFFSPSSGNSDRYLIVYGLMPGADQYAYEFKTSAKGVISVDINGLAPGTSYYFKVQPRNDCQSGEWSNELSTKTGQRLSSFRWSSAATIVSTAVTNRVNPSAITTASTEFSDNQTTQDESPVPTSSPSSQVTSPTATPTPSATPTPVATSAPAPSTVPQDQQSPGFLEWLVSFFRNLF